MTTPDIESLLERERLLQFGERLKRLRKAQRLGTVELAARAGISRNTLRAVESGDPATAIGTYLKIMSILGVGAELALLAREVLSAKKVPLAESLKTPAPYMQLSVKDRQSQEMYSFALHQEAVARLKSSPELVAQALNTVSNWIATGDMRSLALWQEWQQILKAQAWHQVLKRSQHAQQLRKASPLPGVLPEEVRLEIFSKVRNILMMPDAHDAADMLEPTILHFGDM